MVEVTEDIEQANVNAFLKARQCYVKQLAFNQYLVTPKSYAKSRRLVTFILTGGRMKALCQDYRTGEDCPANKFKVVCYHVCKAIRHATELANRNPQHPKAA